MPGSGKYIHEKAQEEEIRKNHGISPSLYADITNRTSSYEKSGPNQGAFWVIPAAKVENWSDTDQKSIKETIERNNKIWTDNLAHWKGIIALKKQLKVQRDDTGQKPGQDYIPPQEPEDREERNQKWGEINALRESVSLEIDAVLSSSSVDSSELKKTKLKRFIGLRSK